MQSAFFRFSNVYFAYFAILGVVSHYFGLYLSSLEFGPVMIGFMLAILTIGRVIGPIIWSTLADKSGDRRSIIQFGSLLALMSFMLIWWLDSVLGFALALAAFSLFWSAVLPQLEALTAQHIKGQAKIYSRIRVWGSISFILLVVASGALFEWFGIKASVEWMTVFLLLLLFLTSLRLPKDRKMRLAKHQPAVSLKNTLLAPNCIIFLLSAFLLQLGFAVYYGFFSIYLTEKGYLGWQIGIMIGFGVLCEVIVFWFAGRILKYFNLKQAFIFCLAVTSLRWLVVANFADHFIWLLLSQSLHAFSFGLHHVAAQQFIRQHFSAAQQSRGQACYSSLTFGVGGALGSFIAGISWQWSPENTYLFAASMTLMACVIMFKFNMSTNKSG